MEQRIFELRNAIREAYADERYDLYTELYNCLAFQASMA